MAHHPHHHTCNPKKPRQMKTKQYTCINSALFNYSAYYCVKIQMSLDNILDLNDKFPAVQLVLLYLYHNVHCWLIQGPMFLKYLILMLKGCSVIKLSKARARIPLCSFDFLVILTQTENRSVPNSSHLSNFLLHSAVHA